MTWDGWGITCATLGAVFIAGITAWAFRVDRGIVRLSRVFDEFDRLREETAKDIDELKAENERDHEALWNDARSKWSELNQHGKDIAGLMARSPKRN